MFLNKISSCRGNKIASRRGKIETSKLILEYLTKISLEKVYISRYKFFENLNVLRKLITHADP